MASKAQRAVTGVPAERWAQLGRVLQEWREDELGYQVRGKFAEDRYINLRLVQDLEKNYRPGTFTKWALEDAAQAYKVTSASIVAFLRGQVDELDKAAPPEKLAVIDPADPLGLPPSPWDDPVKEAADRPYAETIWRRYLDLPRRVTEPTGAQMFPDAPDDAKAWDGISARLPLGDLVWVIADVRRREAGRVPPNSGTGMAAS